MFAFVVFAVAVWYAAFHWRRRWKSLAVTLAAAAALALVAWLHSLLGVWSNGRIQVVIFQSMLYPYTALVVVVALYMSSFPRHIAAPLRCLKCGYDMHGLEEDPDVRCPECGRQLNPPRHPAIRISPAAVATPPRSRAPAPAVLRWPPAEAPAAAPAKGR